MSLHEQEEFLKSIHPFEKLSEYELNFCQKGMTIGYYPKDTTIISPNNISNHFYIIIKGEVHEYNNEELTAVYHESDSFDADSLMYSKTNSVFKVSEDLICYELEKKVFLELLQKNEDFKSFYLHNLSQRLQTLKDKEYSNDMSGFMVARVNEIFLNKICFVSSTTTVREAISKSIELQTSTIVVKDEDRYGVITDSLLKKDVFLHNCDMSTLCKDIAIFPFICVDNDDFLFQVLLILTEHSIKRVGVIKDGELVGTIEQIDILSYFANHVHLIATQIKKATKIEELKKASIDISKSVRSLYIKSVKTTYIAKMVAQLNAKVYEKLFQIVVPSDLQKDCALIVMGSEGRNEQILKTDQDNGLIVKDGVDIEQYRKYMDIFTNHLIEFGFPKCDGDIMVCNPYWSKNEQDYNKQLDHWLSGTSMEDYMHLAIFFDAKVVAGDVKLLENLKENLFNKIDNKDVFMAYFANATLAFETPIGIFSSFKVKNDELDLKKGAIFAIVQGIRSLTLENKLKEHSTIARIKKLNNKGILNREFSTELIEAFELLLRLKLQGQMEKLNENMEIDNNINIQNLSKIQRDMLKDSFHIVNKFKKFISHHFKLNNIS